MLEVGKYHVFKVKRKSDLGFMLEADGNEVLMHFREASKEYNIGDKIGQLIIIPYPEIQFNEISKLSDTDRGDGGFGSTDAKVADVQETPSKPRRKRKSSK